MAEPLVSSISLDEGMLGNLHGFIVALTVLRPLLIKFQRLAAGMQE